MERLLKSSVPNEDGNRTARGSHLDGPSFVMSPDGKKQTLLGVHSSMQMLRTWFEKSMERPSLLPHGSSERLSGEIPSLHNLLWRRDEKIKNALEDVHILSRLLVRGQTW